MHALWIFVIFNAATSASSGFHSLAFPPPAPSPPPVPFPARAAWKSSVLVPVVSSVRSSAISRDLHSAAAPHPSRYRRSLLAPPSCRALSSLRSPFARFAAVVATYVVSVGIKARQHTCRSSATERASRRAARLALRLPPILAPSWTLSRHLSLTIQLARLLPPWRTAPTSTRLVRSAPPPARRPGWRAGARGGSPPIGRVCSPRGCPLSTGRVPNGARRHGQRLAGAPHGACHHAHARQARNMVSPSPRGRTPTPSPPLRVSPRSPCSEGGRAGSGVRDQGPEVM
mmetsp:Transcript_82731/g.165084  ORF Transcript_82731/g.165084 Transcript_82731/m.165084 type:complete len:286 (+) Transcript_82731:419-1276(+)